VAEVVQIQGRSLYFQYPQNVIPLIVSGCLTVPIPFEPHQDYVFGKCNPHGLVFFYQGKLLSPLRYQRIKRGIVWQNKVHFYQAR